MRWPSLLMVLLALCCASGPTPLDKTAGDGRLPKQPWLSRPVALQDTTAEPASQELVVPRLVAAGPLGVESAPQASVAALLEPSSQLENGPAAQLLQSEFGQPVVPPEETVVRVLLYHSIGSHAPRPGVKTRHFKRQLSWMREQGIEIIRLSQLLDFLDGRLWLPRHAAVITIDDGELNGYSVAYRVLKEQQLPFTLGIATEAIEQRAERGALSWEQIREMVESGWCEVASHSITHRAMTSLPDEVAWVELTRSRSMLADAVGLDPQAFFYPLGAQDRRIRRLTEKSGYRAAFVAHGGATTVTTPRFRIPRYDVKPGLESRTFRSFFNHEIRMLGGQ